MRFERKNVLPLISPLVVPRDIIVGDVEGASKKAEYKPLGTSGVQLQLLVLNFMRKRWPDIKESPNIGQIKETLAISTRRDKTLEQLNAISSILTPRRLSGSWD